MGRTPQTFITHIRHILSVQLIQRTKSFVLFTQMSLPTDHFIILESLFLSGGEPSITWEIRNTANMSQIQRLPVPAEGPRT